MRALRGSIKSNLLCCVVAIFPNHIPEQKPKAEKDHQHEPAFK